MNINTLPVHLFTEYEKYEVTNRMECLLKKNPEACIDYCQMITNNTKGFTNLDTWSCYEKNSVPTYLYGREQCDNVYPKLTKDNGSKYLVCLKMNNVTVSFSEVC